MSRKMVILILLLIIVIGLGGFVAYHFISTGQLPLAVCSTCHG